jgi:hypothetical protein
MAYWLVKSEPSVYSWQQFLKDKSTCWEGVRNFSARLNLRAMKKGDQVFFYHSNEGVEIVGIAKVVKEAYPDPTAKEGDWSAVDLAPVKSFKKPVKLAQIKAQKSLSSMALVRISRLSVSPVTDKEWNTIITIAQV